MEILTEKNFERVSTEKTSAPRVVKFINFSREDFTYTWNKVPYTFKAGTFKFMEFGIARHFAKHLINRELLKAGRENDTSPRHPEQNPFFMALWDKAIEELPNTSDSTDATKMQQDVIDMQMRSELGLKPEATPIAQKEEVTEIKEKEGDFEELLPPEDDEEETTS